MTPRLIRMRDAPDYLGMSVRVFNEQVRPHVREVVIGVQGIAFDRNDLDGWADTLLETAAIDKEPCKADDVQRIGRRHESGGSKTWHAKASPASTSGTASGTSTKSSKVTEFKKALDQARGKKRNAT